MNDHSDQRDKIIARLAGQSLRGGTKITSVCPDPELLAAYADHALSANETREWETHFAACPKCQKLLALLAISAEEPQPQQEAARQSASPIVFAPGTTVPAKPSPARPTHWSRHWLVPILSAAAVLTLWLALRPALTPPQTAEVAPVPAAPAPNSPAANAPPQNEIAQADIPPPPAAASPARNDQRSKDLDEAKQSLKKSEPLTAPAPAFASGSSSPALQQQPTPEEDSARLSASGDRIAPAAPQPLSQLNDKQNNSRDETSSKPTDSQLPVPSRRYQPAPPSASAAPSANQPANPSARILGGLGGAASTLSTETVAGLAKAVAPGVTFAAGGGPMWRVGPAGHIERSNDRGTTWRSQSSGVKADLLAGTAVSAQVAWVVGREGVILRTTDGETWRRMNSPNRLMVDWTNIQATDATHASIKSSDDRSFRTEDAGRTWTAQ